MKFSKISGWFLLVILSICISACSSDSDKEDSPTPPAGDSSEIIGYWHYIDNSDEYGKHTEGFYEFRNNNVFMDYNSDEDGVYSDECRYYLDTKAHKLVLWWEPWEYTVYEVRSISNSSMSIAAYDCDLSEIFGNWNKFDVTTAKECIKYIENNSVGTEDAIRLTRSSKSELDKWIKDNE